MLGFTLAQYVEEDMPSALSKFNATPFFDAKKHTFDVDFSSLSCTGKAITGVAIKNGINGEKRVQLLFGNARIDSIESPTEEEFAGVLRSVFHDNQRPEFFFQTIGRPHPLSGRQYCGYSSPWMRGTALGKLLIEADVWMKLLSRNIKPINEEEGDVRFVAWNRNTHLRGGMKTAHDFESLGHPASILLKCENVKYYETEKMMLFPTNPRMEIEDGVLPQFGSYLSSILEDVALDGAPVFERIRELPKMIMIAEWLKRKGVEIDETWLWEKTQPHPSAVPETFQGLKRSVNSEKRSLVKKIDQLRCVMARSAYEAGDVIATPLGPVRRKIDFEFSNVVIDGSRCVADVVETHHIAGGEQPVFQREMTVRGSDCDEDIDWVYEGLDPTSPINAGFVCPEVTSWSELHEQSVEPFWTFKMKGGDVCSAYYGGCSSQFSTERVSSSRRQTSHCPPRSQSQPTCPRGGVRGGYSDDSVQIGGRANPSQGSTSFYDSTGVPVRTETSMRFSARPKGEDDGPVIAFGSMPSSSFVSGYCSICCNRLAASDAAVPPSHCGHDCHKQV